MTPDSTTPKIDTAAEIESESFLVELGKRVKAARRARKLSRRQISEISSVSQRFLSQFESGEGNISIRRFRSICMALELPMEALLQDSPTDDNIAEICSELNHASPAQLMMVREVLNLERPQVSSMNRIALIGLRGAGKSTLAPLLAQEFGYRVIELNHEIQRDAGLDLAEVFSLYGQAGYRRMERDALERIATTEENVVITTGGGIVSDATTYRYLLSQFLTVWISASPEVHMQRVLAQGDRRVMDSTDKPLQALNAILAERKGLYSMAPMSIDTSNLDIASSAAALIGVVRQFR